MGNKSNYIPESCCMGHLKHLTLVLTLNSFVPFCLLLSPGCALLKPRAAAAPSDGAGSIPHIT